MDIISYRYLQDSDFEKAINLSYPNTRRNAYIYISDCITIISDRKFNNRFLLTHLIDFFLKNSQ